MYASLKRRLPQPFADIAAGLWYAGIAVLVLICSGAPDGPFRYLGI